MQSCFFPLSFLCFVQLLNISGTLMWFSHQNSTFSISTWILVLIKKQKSLSITPTGSSPHPSYVQTECELTVSGHCGDQAAHCCRLVLTRTAYTHSDVQPISSTATYIIHTLHKAIWNRCLRQEYGSMSDIQYTVARGGLKKGWGQKAVLKWLISLGIFIGKALELHIFTAKAESKSGMTVGGILMLFHFTNGHWACYTMCAGFSLDH